MNKKEDKQISRECDQYGNETSPKKRRKRRKAVTRETDYLISPRADLELLIGQAVAAQRVVREHGGKGVPATRRPSPMQRSLPHSAALAVLRRMGPYGMVPVCNPG